MDSTFITVVVIGILAIMSPGPDFLIVTRNSLLYSKRVGVATALGIVVGNIWWIAASVLGISLIITETVLLFNALKWLGALYLIYLGVKSLRSKGVSIDTNADGAKKREHLSVASAFQIGLLTNILNPKCAMFFLSFFSVVITPQTPTLLQWAYGLLIMAMAACWFCLVAVTLSARKIRLLFSRFSVWFDRFVGGVLICLGIKVALYEQK